MVSSAESLGPQDANPWFIEAATLRFQVVRTAPGRRTPFHHATGRMDRSKLLFPGAENLNLIEGLSQPRLDDRLRSAESDRASSAAPAGTQPAIEEQFDRHIGKQQYPFLGDSRVSARPFDVTRCRRQKRQDRYGRNSFWLVVTDGPPAWSRLASIFVQVNLGNNENLGQITGNIFSALERLPVPANRLGRWPPCWTICTTAGLLPRTLVVMGRRVWADAANQHSSSATTSLPGANHWGERCRACSPGRRPGVPRRNG